MIGPESETMIKVLVAEELNTNLDEILPYQPYEPSRLDHALIDEELIGVMSRWSVLWDELDADGAASKFSQFAIADRLYGLEFPDDSWEDDADFMRCVEKSDGRYTVELSPALLYKYGSTEAHTAENLLPTSIAEPSRRFCIDHDFTQEQADYFFGSVSQFKDSLYEMQFIANDEMLRVPLQALGMHTMGLLLPREADLIDARKAWADFLDGEIGFYDFVGENPEVMTDTVEGLVAWTCERVVEYAETGEFSDQSKWHYGPNGEHWFDRPENKKVSPEEGPEVFTNVIGQQSLFSEPDIGVEQ